MPPRRKAAIIKDPLRDDLLKEFCLTEAEISRLKDLPLDEALFRIGHEKKVQDDWAARRAAFLTEEIRTHRATPHPSNGRINNVMGSVVEFVIPKDPIAEGIRTDNPIPGIKMT